jgi:signal transduction histidine kinase
MNLRSKTFLAIFASSSVVALALSLVLLILMSHGLFESFSGRYQTVLNTMSLAFSKIEVISEDFAARELRSGRFDQEIFLDELEDGQDFGDCVSLAKSSLAEFYVSPFFRDESPGFAKKTIAMKSTTDNTLRVRELSLDIISDVVEKLIASDGAIKSVGLYAADGTTIGYMSRKGSEWILQDNSLKNVLVEGQSISRHKAEFVREIEFRPSIGGAICCSCQLNETSGSSSRYFMRLEVATDVLMAAFKNQAGLILVALIGAFVLAYLFATYLASGIVARIQSINEGIQSIIRSNGFSDRLQVQGNDEASKLATGFNRLLDALQHQQRELLEAEKQKSLASIASQVAHDIRSPLAALDSIVNHSKHMDATAKESIRSVVRSIKDVAQNLLKHYKSRSIIPQSSVHIQKHCLVDIINGAIEEVEHRFSTLSSNMMIFEKGEFAEFGFVEGDRSDLRRAVVNGLTNAIESYDTAATTLKLSPVIIQVTAAANELIVRINDHGSGLSAAALNELLVGNLKSSKPKGTGLGFQSMRSKVERVGGRVEVTSELGVGTIVSLIFPTCLPNDSFVSWILLAPNTNIVAIDDDPSIVSLWRRRFELLNIPVSQFFGLTGENELVTLNKLLQSDEQPLLVLVDHDLRGWGQNGLEILDSISGDRVTRILVTNRNDEPEIEAKCELSGCKLLGKTRVSDVGLIVEQDRNPIGVLLVEDNIYVAESWKTHFETRNIKFVSVMQAHELLGVLNQTNRSTRFYVDQSLAESVKGVEILRWLYLAGYRELYLATNHDRIEFSSLTWIKDVTSKDPPSV